MEESILEQLGITCSGAKNVQIFRWVKINNQADNWSGIAAFVGDVPLLKITFFDIARNKNRRIEWSEITELGPRINPPRQ